MSSIPAPSEFSSIGLLADKFHPSDKKSWRGPCPQCGGTRRYVIFTDNPFPLWHGFCDECGRKDKYWHGRQPIDPARAMELQRRADEERAREQAERAKRLADFSTSELWQELHRRLDTRHREWWRSQGVPDDWQDFYQLGYKPEHISEHNGQKITTPAYSIPKFDLDWQLKNIDYRLIEAPHEWGKYRPQAGLSPAPFFSDPDYMEFPEEVYIVEGSKKAMVCHIYLSIPKPLFFIGVPSCNSWAGITSRLKDRRVWIMLDNGAEIWAQRMAKEIGKNARIITLPDKPDDLVLKGMLYSGRLEDLKRTSRGM